MKLPMQWQKCAADVSQYLPDAQLYTVQGFVQRRSDALCGGDGALRTLLLHVCEEVLCVGLLALPFAVLCGDIQA